MKLSRSWRRHRKLNWPRWNGTLLTWGIIAGVAPMLGFIGTISGIIKIFYSISLADNISIGIIAGGLYEKMITSGAGLVVGVIAYVCYHMLEQKIQRYTLHLQEDALDFLKALTGSSK